MSTNSFIYKLSKPIIIKKYNPFLMEGFAVEGFGRDDSYYVRFNDEDIDELTHYAFDMGYAFEPEVINADP